MVGLTGVELSSSTHETVPASSAFFKSQRASSRAPSGYLATATPPFPARSPGRCPLNSPVQPGSEHQCTVVVSGSLLVTLMRTRSPWRIRSVGPGT